MLPGSRLKITWIVKGFPAGQSQRQLYCTTTLSGHQNAMKLLGILHIRGSFISRLYNGFLISRPCNHVLLSVAERMVHIGPVGIKGATMTWEQYVAHPSLMNWYNLKLLAMAIAERAPNELGTDVKCSAGAGKCLLFENVPSQNTPEFTNGRPVVLYKDDHNLATAVFDSPFSKQSVKQVRDNDRNGAGGGMTHTQTHPGKVNKS